MKRRLLTVFTPLKNKVVRGWLLVGGVTAAIMVPPVPGLARDGLVLAMVLSLVFARDFFRVQILPTAIGMAFLGSLAAIASNDVADSLFLQAIALSIIALLPKTFRIKLRLHFPRLTLAHLKTFEPSRTMARNPINKWTVFFSACAFAIALTLGLLGTHDRDLGYRIPGPHVGQAVWNVHYLEAPLERRGSLYLVDPSISSISAKHARVGSVDFPILVAIKELHPGALNGARLSSVLTAIGIFTFALSLVMFFYSLHGSLIAAMGAAVAFLFLPVGSSIRQAEPFDLVLPLMITALVINGSRWQQLVVPGAIASPYLSTGGGAEIAVLLGAVAIARLGPPKFLWFAAAAALTSELIAQKILAIIAPDATVSLAWWQTQTVPWILQAERLPSKTIFCLLFAAAAAGGVALLWRSGLRKQAAFSTVLLALSLIFAIPSSVGHLQLLTPAMLLDGLFPLSWPSARLLEVTAIACSSGLAYLFAKLMSPLRGRQQVAQGLGATVLAFWLLNLTAPRFTAPDVIAPVRLVGRIVQFPIAAPISEAGLQYATDAFQNRISVLQAVPFVSGQALPFDADPQVESVLRQLRSAKVQYIVIRSDIYQRPWARYIVRPLHGDLDTSLPNLEHNRNYNLIELLSDDSSVYKLRTNKSR